MMESPGSPVLDSLSEPELAVGAHVSPPEITINAVEVVEPVLPMSDTVAPPSTSLLPCAGDRLYNLRKLGDAWALTFSECYDSALKIW